MAATLALWGARTNLTAEASDPAEISFHIIDSLAPVAFAECANRETLEAALAEGASALDLGSGAGFPGLVLAAAFEARFMLAEARRKRASYLQVAAHEIQLENVTIERRRGSAGGGNIAAGLYHLVTARAFGTLFLYASADQMLDVRTGEPLDDSRAHAMHFAERASWTYRLPHGERVVTRTAVLWRKSPSA
jgi:16S rRNA G527 N7-methylase RsmG